MGVRLLVGTYDGTEDKVALVDSVTGVVFGPLLESETEAEGFLTWLENGGDDARLLSTEELVGCLSLYREESQ